MEINAMTTGAELVGEERERQVSEEGYSAERDQTYVNGEIALAAIAYAAPRPVYLMTSDDRGIRFSDPWIWDKKYDKRKGKNRIRRTVVAAALLCAEVDRLLALQRELSELEVVYREKNDILESGKLSTADTGSVYREAGVLHGRIREIKDQLA